MNANETTLRDFYTAFARLDPDGMARCYAEDASFDDEVFSLRGKRDVAGMWRMLCEATRAKGADVWQLRFGDVKADGMRGQAHWDAHYRFSATGRIVDNSIDAQFEFAPDGRIGSRPGAAAPRRAARASIRAAGPGRPSPTATSARNRNGRSAVRIHAACEDYRASAGIDLDHDRDSRARGEKIACELLVL